MGLFSGLFGGGPKAATDPNLGAYQQAAYQSLGNITGAKKLANGQYDYANANKPINGSEKNGMYTAGSNTADYNPTNQAIKSFQNPTLFNKTYQGSTYNPYQFNYAGLPQSYAENQLQLGGKGLRDQQAGNIAQAQEAIGTRRPGLLLKATQGAQRDAGQQLAQMRTQYGVDLAKTNADYARAQQEGQAGENAKAATFNAGEGYKGYQSQSDLEKANADNLFKNMGALNEAGLNKITSQQGVLGGERDQQNKNMEYLRQLLQQATGTQNQAAQQSGENRKTTTEFLGKLARG